MTRNKSAGNGLERRVMHDFREIGYDRAVSSRSESRNMDNKKVDLCYTDPFYIQCKNVKGKLDYHLVLEEMPKDKNHINVIVHKMTKKANKNFVEVGKYVIMNYDDFLAIAELIHLMDD